MEIYFLKSAACLAFLMLFYKLLLERESFHVFKRWYLLAAVVASFIIPAISFTTYVEQASSIPLDALDITTVPVPETSDATPVLPYVLWSMYGLGCLFFSLKFLFNLRSIFLRIKSNPRFKEEDVTMVLLQEEVTPHTFLDYIFLNRNKFEQHDIPHEVFEHEQAHAKQKHSLDIIFLELIQIILWFYPLIYLVKKAVKLNHEFLADKAVLRKGTNTAEYQKTLLLFSTEHLQNNLVNSINYSIIKKRFTVMKTQSSKRKIWLNSLLLIPLLALLLYSFTGRKTEIKDPASVSSEVSNAKTIEISIDAEGVIEVDGKIMTLKEIEQSLKPEKDTNFSITASPIAPKEQMEGLIQLVLGLKMDGQVTVCSIGENIEESVLNDIFSTSGTQEKATPAMLEEYNRLVKYYNSKDNDVIKKAELQRIDYIYRLMTPQQREKAEGRKFVLPGRNGGKNANKQHANMRELPPPPPPPAPPAPERLGKQVPPPPPPPSPVEAVEKWLKEDAKFFYNGKEVSGKRALEVVQKNEGKNLSVKIEESNSGKTIRISDNKR